MKTKGIEKTLCDDLLKRVLEKALDEEYPQNYFKKFKDKSRFYLADLNVKRLYKVITLVSHFIISKPREKIDLKQYKNRSDLLGYIANCENLVESTTRPALNYIISFFESIENYTIKTNSILPRDLRKKFEEFFILTLYLFVHTGETPNLEEEILKFHFEHSKLQTSKRTFFTEKTTTRKYSFIDMQINETLAKGLSKILSSPITTFWIENIIFSNCHITGTFDLSKGLGRVEFQRCTIESDIKLPQYCRGLVGFYGSKILGKIIMNPCSMYLGLVIWDCHFLKKSALIMRNVTYLWKSAYFEIKNSIFDGDIKIHNADLLFANTVISNLKINGNFSYMNLYLNQDAVIEKINAKKYANITARLKECRFESDYVVEKSKKDIEKNSSKDNQTDWYVPKKAATYIRRSVIFLAKMRARDKIEVKNDSIPYLGEKKSIVYPKDALDAYLTKNYQKLEELRKKYNFMKK